MSVFTELYKNDFTADITGVSAFNGGSVSRVGNSLIIDNNTGGARGAILSQASTVSQQHILVIEVLDFGTASSLRIYSQWAVQVAEITTLGIHRVSFNSNASGNNQVVLVCDGAAPTDSLIEIGYMSLNEYNPYAVEASAEHVKNSIKDAFLVGSDFVNDSKGVSIYGFTYAITPKNGQLEIVSTNNTHFIVFGLNMIPENSKVEFSVSIAELSVPVIVRMWTDELFDTTEQIVIDTPGDYTMAFIKRSDYTSIANRNGITIAGQGGGVTIKLNSYSIRVLPQNLFLESKFVQIGEGTYVEKSSGAENVEHSVVVGHEARTDKAGAVVIGAQAHAFVSDLFGANQGGGEAVAVGVEAKAYGWRNTAIGAEASAGGQSATAVGSGSEAHTPHSVALGRGSYISSYPRNPVGNEEENGNVLCIDLKSIYLKNGWSHLRPTAVSGQTRGDLVDPSIEEVALNGVDAFDARYPQWLAGTSYSENHIVYQNGNLYYSNVDSNQGNDPDGDAINWTFWMVEPKGAASDFNKDAGHLALKAGRGTGSGEGGELRMYTAPTTGSKGANEKNDPVLSAKLKSDATITDGTDLWLLDRASDEMKRVGVKQNASAGTNKVISSKSLYLISN